jgi:hypothetical protein
MEWLDVDGFEGYYKISNTGDVMSLDRVVYYADGRVGNYKGKKLSPTVCRYGYPRVVLQMGDQKLQTSVHRLVAKAFLENKDCLTHVNHINEDREDNRSSNLEWCTHRENLIHSMKYGDEHKRSKVTLEQIEEMRLMVSGGAYQKEVGALYGITQSHLSRLLRGQGRVTVENRATK